MYLFHLSFFILSLLFFNFYFSLIKILKNDDNMYISILVRNGLIVYVDERLTNLLGQSAKNWIGKRPIDYLYKHDTNLLLTKLCELTNKIVSSLKLKKDLLVIKVLVKHDRSPQ
jgi:hypothetical protein